MQRFLALTVILVLLVGCSGGSGTSGGETPTGGEPGGSPVSEPAKPKEPVVIVQGAEPPTMDPQFHESGAASNVYSAIFDHLVEFDRGMVLQPSLAESWSLSEDELTWTLKLRKGVKFHNGEDFNAKAVAYTINRAVDPKMIEAKIFDPFPTRVGLDKVTVVDEYTVSISTKKPNSMFLVYLSFVPMLAPDYYASTSLQDLALKPVGTGPWMLKEWVKDDRIVVEAFPDYWRGKPEIDSLVFRAVPEASTRLNMLQTGKADIVANISPEDAEIVKSDSSLRLSVAIGGRRVFMGIPAVKNAKYANKEVRQALNYAVNFDAINTALLGSLAKGRMQTPVNGDFWINASLKPYAYDPEKAKSMLQAANFPMGEKITLYTPNGRYLKDKEMAEAVAADLRKIGLNVEVQVLEWTVFSGKLTAKEFDDIYLMGLGSRFHGPEDIQHMSNQNAFDVTGWSTLSPQGDEYEKIVKELEFVFDQNEAKKMLDRAQEIVYDEAPWIYLWKQTEVFAVTNRIDWEASGNSRIALWLPNEPSPKYTK